MNNSLARILDGMIATLRTEVIPRLDDEFARGQAFGAVDLLNNLKPRIDWLVTPLFDEVRDQRALLARLAEVFRGTAAPLEAAFEEPGAGTPAHALEQLRNELDMKICASIDWLARERAALPAATVAAAEAAIKQHMQVQLKREMSLTPKPLFAEIARAE